MNKCPFQMKPLRQSKNARYSRDQKAGMISELWITLLPYNAFHCHRAYSGQDIVWRLLLWRIFCFSIPFYQETGKADNCVGEGRRTKVRGAWELLQEDAVALVPPASQYLPLRWSKDVFWKGTEIDWDNLPLLLHPGHLRVLYGCHHWTSEFALGEK